MQALHTINQRLMARLDGADNVFVLNAQRWCDEAGRGAHSAKLWYMGKVPFHTSVFQQAANDVKGAIQGITGMTRKLVVVDLDDTLWGGIVGDVGWENLRSRRPRRHRRGVRRLPARPQEPQATRHLAGDGEQEHRVRGSRGDSQSPRRWCSRKTTSTSLGAGQPGRTRRRTSADLVAGLNLARLQSTVFMSTTTPSRERACARLYPRSFVRGLA